MTNRELAQLFIEGATEGRTGTKSKAGSTKIINNQFIHYETPILERCSDGSFIYNKTRYSIATGQIQKMLVNEILPQLEYKTVGKVEQNYKGSLADFL